MTTETEVGKRLRQWSADWDGHAGLTAAAAYRLAANELDAAPIGERAPEVSALLAQIRGQEASTGGSWPGGDTVSILCEWFTAQGYDIDGPLAGDDDGPLTCERCGARVHNLSADGQCITCIAGAPEPRCNHDAPAVVDGVCECGEVMCTCGKPRAQCRAELRLAQYPAGGAS